MITLPPIPWSHSVSDFGSVWQWDTPAFLVTVNGDMRSFYWTIADKSANAFADPCPFADGQAANFEQAERSIRETIGKAYPVSMGYQHYAGSLATTFMIGTGETVDLGVYIGRRVSVLVASREGPDEVYRGTAKVEHYDFVLVNGDEALHITPSYIMSIDPDGPSGVAAVRKPAPAATRTVQGSLTPGCTGIPGFLPNTIEHTGKPCPIHEQ